MSAPQNRPALDDTALDDTALDRAALVIAHDPVGGGACEIERRLVARGLAVETHTVVADLERPGEVPPFPELDRYDVVVPMGSLQSLMKRDEIGGWVEAELDLLRRAHERGIPVLGICFGGQLIAEALGGSVELAPVQEIGWCEIQPPPGGDNPVGPGPWLEWHHDRFQVPPEAEVLAVTDHAVQLFRIGTTVGTQFHPEVNLAHVECWLAQGSDEYLASCGIDRAEILAETAAKEMANIEQCGRLVDWFLDDVAFPEGA